MSKPPAWLVHRYDSVTSTMGVAARLAEFGARERTVVFSGEQTAGRGRSGRSWHAPANTALFCTIVVRPPVAPERLSTLPLVSGIAVAETLEQISGHDARLKWPNDVWLGPETENSKVAGILVTSRLNRSVVDFALIGIGVNILSDLEKLPAGATSIHASIGRAVPIEKVLDVLLDRFDRNYEDFVAADGRPSLAGWRLRAALLGETVTVEDAGRVITGRFVDIDEDGALLIEESRERIRKVVAGDLVRGPRVAEVVATAEADGKRDPAPSRRSARMERK